MNRVLIVNAYAIGNRGDAAIIQGLIHTLRLAGADRVTVAPRAPEQRAGWIALGADEVAPPLLSVHEVPKWVRRTRILLLAYISVRILRALLAPQHAAAVDPAVAAYRDSGLIVAAGGAYLGGPKVGINLIKSVNIAYARVMGRPVIVAPVTINPSRHFAVRALLRWTLRGATVFVRDRPSQLRLAELKISSTLAPDLALRAPSVRLAVAQLADVPRPDSPRTICWSPRSYRPDHDAWRSREELENKCLGAVMEVMTAAGLRLRFIPQVTATRQDDDRQAARRLRSKLPPPLQARTEIAEPAETLEAAVSQFASCDVLLASRLHASLLALAAGVPSLTIAYEPKVPGVLAELGLDDRAVGVDVAWSGADLARRILELMNPEERRRTVLAAARAESGFDRFDAVLRETLKQ